MDRENAPKSLQIQMNANGLTLKPLGLALPYVALDLSHRRGEAVVGRRSEPKMTEQAYPGKFCGS